MSLKVYLIAHLQVRKTDQWKEESMNIFTTKLHKEGWG